MWYRLQSTHTKISTWGINQCGAVLKYSLITSTYFKLLFQILTDTGTKELLNQAIGLSANPHHEKSYSHPIVQIQRQNAPLDGVVGQHIL